jgi:hypothetical protein
VAVVPPTDGEQPAVVVDNRGGDAHGMPSGCH